MFADAHISSLGTCGETGYWKQPLWLVSLWQRTFDALRTRSYNEVKFSQRWSFFKKLHCNYFHRDIRPNCVWYEFNILLTSDYKKRRSDLYTTPSTEYWNCKVGFMCQFLKLKVGCSTYVLVHKWNAVRSRTSDHVKCWKFKLIYFECWNVKLKVGWYNLMLAAEVECGVECWVLKLIFGGDWTSGHQYAT